ncbi:MAG TPA: transposase [Rhizobiales bacterium]|nr:transposase [Hyphomicrobiales bacterium]
MVAIIREYEAGAKVSELCRRHGMSNATFYKWKAKYGGMQVSDVKKLKDMEEENRKLKKLLAETMLDNDALKGLLAKNF